MNFKLNKLDIDKWYVDFILNNTHIFSKVDPNILSIVGLLTDFIIYFSITNKFLLLTAFLMFIRFSCDVLDGAVARKYKKVSDLGGILDTVADNTLIFLLSLSITTILQLKYRFIISLCFPIINLMYMYHIGSIIHHYNMKLDGSKIQNIYSFLTRNNCLVYLICYLLIILL